MHAVSLPLLVVLSGPSGVGKDALVRALRDAGAPLFVPVTCTTRPLRREEVDGIHYHFLAQELFLQMRERGELMEWAQVYGHWYGVPKASVREALERGEDVLVKTDVQGAATIKRLVPEAIAIFLAPSTLMELEGRLRRRVSEPKEDLALRLESAPAEMAQGASFDYCVVNAEGGLDAAVRDVLAILRAEKCRVQRRPAAFR